MNQEGYIYWLKWLEVKDRYSCLNKAIARKTLGTFRMSMVKLVKTPMS